MKESYRILDKFDISVEKYINTGELISTHRMYGVQRNLMYLPW